jgi:glycosyl transferase family 25
MSGLTSEQSMHLAGQLVTIGDLAGALARCEEILAADPDCAPARQLAIRLHFQTGLLAGYTLNLEKRPDRLAECRTNWAEFGYPEDSITLIKAVEDRDYGAIGCGKSHISAMMDFFIRGHAGACMVLEDDFDFIRPASDLAALLQQLKSVGLPWDVLLLTGNDVVPFEQPRGVPGLLRVFEAQSGAGYIVNKSYIPTLLGCFIETVHQMERFRGFDARKLVTSRLAIDMAWKRLQRQGNWYIFNPTFGHQRAGHSDIEGMFKDYRRGTFYQWPMPEKG